MEQQMNRCEHGEKISLFCVSQHCSWREAGGCEDCLRKYHNHPGAVSVTQQEVALLTKRYSHDQRAKPRCRQLQETLFNYLSTLKNEISASLDLLSRHLVNQIGYPFLSGLGLMSTYKKFKNREFKKITQKEFKRFYEASLNCTQRDFEVEEGATYQTNTKKCLELVHSLQIIKSQYESLASPLAGVVSFQRTLAIKISDIVTHLYERESPSKQMDHHKQTHMEANKHYENARNLIDISPQKERQNELNTKHGHTRDVSLEQKINKNLLTPIKESFLEKTSLQNNHHRDKRSASAQEDRVKEKIKEQEKEKNRQKEREKAKKQKGKKVDGMIQSTAQEKMIILKNELNNHEMSLLEKKKLLLDIVKNKEDSPKRYPHIVQLKNYLEVPQRKDTDSILSPEKKQNNRKNQTRQVNISIVQQEQSQQLEGLKALSRAFTKLPLPDSARKDEPKKEPVLVPLLNLKQIIRPKEESPEVLKKRNVSQDTTQTKLSDTNHKSSKKTSPEPKQQTTLLLEQEEKSLALLFKAQNMPVIEAIPLVEAALTLAENNLSAADYLSFLYLAVGRAKDCLVLCNKTLEKLKDVETEATLVLLNNKAIALSNLGRFSEAIVLIEDSVNCKQKLSFRRVLGDCYLSLGQTQKALSCYEKLRNKKQENEQVMLYNMAVCFYTQKNYLKAKESIGRAIALKADPTFLELQREIELREGERKE